MSRSADPASTSTHADGVEGDVRVTVTDGVATIRFSHPKGNSLPGSLLRELASAIHGLRDADAAHVIVLRSSETGPFCAGASFDELRAVRDEEGGKEFFMGFARVILAMIRSPKVIIARVHGKVVGGGVGLVAAADYAMAVDSASVRLSELAVGIGPFVVGPVIERKIGRAGFSAMAIDADWRTALWAHEFGLYSQLFESVHALDSGLEFFTRKLARSNPGALTRMKQIFSQGTEEWDELLEARAAMSGQLVLSSFTREAIAAFDRGKRG